MKMCLKTSVGS